MSGSTKRMRQAINATTAMVNDVFEMVGDEATDEMWEKVAQLDADYNYRMADWVAHGGKDKLAEFQKAHARLKEAWAVFGDGE
tara:strand:- start:436 stop:684 length:249 start_codon:yes stop_codon:yes gene_type:complete